MTLHLSPIQSWLQTHSALIGRNGGDRRRFTSTAKPELRKHTPALRERSAPDLSVHVYSRRWTRVFALSASSTLREEREAYRVTPRIRIRTVAADIRQIRTWAKRTLPAVLRLFYAFGEDIEARVSVSVTLGEEITGLSFERELLLLKACEEHSFALRLFRLCVNISRRCHSLKFASVWWSFLNGMLKLINGR